MNNNKLQTITNLFEGKAIRSIWDSEKEEYYFSVVDVISALTNAKIPRNYWSDLKRKLISEGSQLHEKIVQLKMKSPKDNKKYLTDTLDTEGIFRLIESVPSTKAEPFKIWLAKLGRQKVDEVFDPSIGIDEMIDFYVSKGYTLEWIEARMKAIIDRKRLTKVWHDNDVKEASEYAILTNAIYKEWSGMTASEYKAFKNIRKENLRDNMSRIEVLLTDLGELAAHDIAEREHPQGLSENMKVASRGGEVANDARMSYEKATNKSAISNKNTLDYKYTDDNKLIENK